MAELNETTGIPIPTIKYYIREGLVAPGRPTGRNQADYTEEHVRRLKLVRALVEYGGLSIAVIRDLIAQVDNPELEAFDLLAAAQKTVTQAKDPRPGPYKDGAERRLHDLLAKRGWRIRTGDPAYRTAVGVLAALDEVGRQDMLDVLDDYAEAAERIAEIDLGLIGDVRDRDRAVEIVVIGTSVGDTLVATLRRLAQATVGERLYT
ncbi:MerR HTH family regulatory protein [Streptosporangium subroseum]|uniref:MerR HTH family regulatory protein n=1 Tax=Streptosporangium subroseum TaxID=106412 RepID=A0A239CTA7_9ACTN|nr:MerR family transcriptional regulator [Streptosporangium subroseum]SNS23445.1 MerR HTH family regulatory protein [Streptosporangium subroseum]